MTETYAFRPKPPPRDGRQVVVARCYDQQMIGDCHYGHLTGMDYVRIGWMEGTTVALECKPHEFWPYAIRGGSTLLVLGCADRDMAILGEPPGWELQWRLHCPSRAPNLYRSVYRRKTRKLEVIHVGNWHPEGRWCAGLGFPEVLDFVRAYVNMVRSEDLGKLEWTMARQARNSLQRYLDGIEERLWYHQDPLVHRWEWEAKKAQAPVRIAAVEGHYDRLYETDFTAFYLHVMASKPMPKEFVGWWPDGTSVDGMHRIMNHEDGYLVLADVTTTSGQRQIWATPQVRMQDVAEVHRLSWYKPTDLLAGWAKKMFELRERQGDAALRTAVKGLGVRLWGWLSRDNRVARPDHTYRPGDEAMEPGDSWEEPEGHVTRIDWRGNKTRSEPWAMQQRSFQALGAHVLAYGRQYMEDLIRTAGEENVVYAHTDSVWTTTGVPSTGSFGDAILGRTTVTPHRNVEFIDGMRIVEGDLKAHPGVSRPGQRRYLPFDRGLRPEGTAQYTIT